jgi:orotidine-5'-phosphate decarboxylase
LKNYIEQLKSAADKYSSIVCLGLDPDIAEIPLEGPPGEQITHFYQEILNKIIQKSVYPGAVKPNYAFYAQYGIEGLQALTQVIDLFKAEGLPVILDAKRGDIGNTARAYAREIFDFFKADAVTLAPYMGYDSIEPFVKDYPDKGYYVLIKTSNQSSSEIQNIEIDDRPLYLHLAEHLLKWYHPGLGAVVGATFPDELSRVVKLFHDSDKEIPLLIPGVGSQGGDALALTKILNFSSDIRLHRVNSSRAINYAYKKHEGLHFADAAVMALKELSDSINSERDR